LPVGFAGFNIRTDGSLNNCWAHLHHTKTHPAVSIGCDELLLADIACAAGGDFIGSRGYFFAYGTAIRAVSCNI
jgi:hypothetical protein